MPLVIEREAVLDVYAAAAEKGWTIPAFGTENRTTTEAILAAAKEHGETIGRDDIPITVAITNRYTGRSQSTRYTHTGLWNIGLNLLLSDLRVLTSPSSPFCRLNVMAHLDHIQPDRDAELLDWDMSAFSSIMFDASTAPMAKNIEMTRRFVEKERDKIVIEGACDEIVEAGSAAEMELTTPERALEYAEETGADFLVANLGTEHRAAKADLQYHSDLARAIKARIGPQIVLHGCSSLPADQLQTLFDDGVCKVNIWTRLERDSAPILLEDLLKNAARMAGEDTARRLAEQKLLGDEADLTGPRDISCYTASYRRRLVFESMKEIVKEYLALWYR